MTIYLQEYLPNFPLPLVSSTYNIEDYFKKDDDYTYFYNNSKIIKKNSSIKLSYKLNKKDYVDFTDFFLNILEEGAHLCILDVEKDGKFMKIEGDFVKGLNVSCFPTYFLIDCLFIIKKDII